MLCAGAMGTYLGNGDSEANIRTKKSIEWDVLRGLQKEQKIPICLSQNRGH